MSIPSLQHIALWMATAGVAVVTLCVLLEGYFPILELLAHFTLQYACISLLLAVWAWFARYKTHFWLLVICLSFHVGEMIYIHFAFASEATKQGQEFKVMQANMLVGNRDPQAAMQALLNEAERHDVMVLMEYPLRFPDIRDSPLAESFPYSYSGRSHIDNGFNTTILSKTPFKVEEVEGLGVRSEYLRITLMNNRLRMVALHSLVPGGEAAIRSRHRQHETVFEDVSNESIAAFAVGDFNQTPYASAFQHALQKYNLSLASSWNALLPSYPSQPWLFFARIPIDNLVVNHKMYIHDRTLIPMPGSNHYAVSNRLVMH